MTSLHVGNLHPNVSKSDLLKIFQDAGPIESAKLCRDWNTLESLGYGFVNFQQPADALWALEHYNGESIMGRPMRISWSWSEPPRYWDDPPRYCHKPTWYPDEPPQYWHKPPRYQNRRPYREQPKAAHAAPQNLREKPNRLRMKKNRPAPTNTLGGETYVDHSGIRITIGRADDCKRMVTIETADSSKQSVQENAKSKQLSKQKPPDVNASKMEKNITAEVTVEEVATASVPAKKKQKIFSRKKKDATESGKKKGSAVRRAFSRMVRAIRKAFTGCCSATGTSEE